MKNNYETKSLRTTGRQKLREYKPDVSPDVSRQLTKWKLSLWRYEFSTSGKPFSSFYLPDGKRGEEESILEIPARFSATNDSQFFSAFSIVSDNVWTCPRKITGRHNCGNQGEFHGQCLTGTRPDNYLPRTRFRIPWI